MTHSGVLWLVIGDEELLVVRGVTAVKDLVAALLAGPLGEFYRLSRGRLGARSGCRRSQVDSLGMCGLSFGCGSPEGTR